MKITNYYNIINVVFIVQQKKPEFITKRTLSKIRCKTQALKSEVPLKHVPRKRKWQVHHQSLESFPCLLTLKHYEP